MKPPSFANGTKIGFIAIGATLFMAANHAQAQILVDVGPSGQPLQSGYVALTVPSTQANSAAYLTSSVSGIGAVSQTFDDINLGTGVLQNFTVGLSADGAGGYYQRTVSAGGFSNVTDGMDGSYGNLLDDGYFGRGTLTLTLSGLSAGTYVLVTSDRGDGNTQGGSSTITSSLTDANGTTASSYSQPGSYSATDAGYDLVTYQFQSNGTGTITLDLTGAHYSASDYANGNYSNLIAGPDNAVINGFSLNEVETVPEPRSILLLGMGLTFVYFARRRKMI